MKRVVFFTYIFSLVSIMNASAQVRYLKAIGGPGDEEAKRMVQASDGDFVAVGYVNSALVTHGGSAKDALVFKISPEGVLKWAWAIGGNKEEEFRDIVFYQGYYYCVGLTNTYVKNSTTSNERDILLVKLEPDGDVVWAKHFGEPTATAYFNDVGVAIDVTPTSGIILAGVTGSGVPTESDIVAINVKPDGTVVFAKKFDTANIGGQSPDNPYDINADGNGNYFISCGMRPGSGDGDGMMLKINSSGNLIWVRKLRTNNLAENCESTVYNVGNNRLYSAGLRNNNNDDSDVLIWTLRADNGQPGSNPPPRVKRYNSPNQRRRMLLYPKKPSGFYGTLYGNTGDNTKLAAMDAVVFSLDESLSGAPIWQKTFGLGAEYDYISHLANCTGSDDIIGIGGTRSPWLNVLTPETINYDIFVARVSTSGTIPNDPTCIASVNYPNDTLAGLNDDYTANVTTTDLMQIANWVDNDTIKLPASINAMNYLATRDTCPEQIIGLTSGLSQGQLDFIQNGYSAITVEECASLDCSQNLKFTFVQDVLSSSFLIYDDLGYEYFETTEKDKLAEGVKYEDIKLEPGLYYWKLESPLPNGFVEHHNGQIKID